MRVVMTLARQALAHREEAQPEGAHFPQYRISIARDDLDSLIDRQRNEGWKDGEFEGETPPAGGTKHFRKIRKGLDYNVLVTLFLGWRK